MLAMSLRLIYVREDHLQQADWNRNVAQTLINLVRKSLMVDTLCRAEAMVEEIVHIWRCSKGHHQIYRGHTRY